MTTLQKKLLTRYLLAAFTLISQAAFAVPLSLGIGQQEALTFEALAKSVSVDHTGVVDVSKGETKSVVVLTGKGEGTASVTIKLDDGKTIVYDVTVNRSSRNSLSSLVARLRRVPGITIEQQGSKYLVSGQFRNRSDQLVLQNALRDYPGLIVDTTDPDIVESNAVVKAVNRVLADNDIANLQAHAYGQIIALEGSPKDEPQKALAMRIARMIAPNIEDHVTMESNGAPPISIEVLFVESAKNNNKTYGIHGLQQNFAGVENKQTGPFRAESSGYSVSRQMGKQLVNWQVGSLAAFLRLEQTKSSSRIVSNPKLIARSGQKALFESGGSFWVIQEEVDSTGKTKRSYVQQQTGITLSIEPRIDAIGQIDSKIKTTITDTTERPSTDAPPNMIKSNLETAITIPSGQSILLSGLSYKKAKKSVSRVPLLADIPLIGELFKERTQEFEDKEVAVIVTMKRVAPSETRPQAAEQLLDTSDDDVSFSFFD